jgi:hypothetical protein
VTSPVELAPVTPALAANSRLRQRKWGLIRLASPLALLGVWQLGSALGLIPQDVLPAPSLILEAGVELIENGQLADALAVSGRRVVEGLLRVPWCRTGNCGRAVQMVRGDGRPADADDPRAATPRVDPVVHPVVRHR